MSEDDLALLSQTVEYTVRAIGNPEVPAHEVGLAILGPLRVLDEVAYLRFASVYRNFESLEDFETEVALLRVERDSVLLDLCGDTDESISLTSNQLTSSTHAQTRARGAVVPVKAVPFEGGK